MPEDGGQAREVAIMMEIDPNNERKNFLKSELILLIKKLYEALSGDALGWCQSSEDSSLMNIEINDEDLKLFDVHIHLKHHAPVGAFLGSKCSNMELLMAILRKQQFVVHNRYIKVTLVKYAEDGTVAQQQHFFDKSVVKR